MFQRIARFFIPEYMVEPSLISGRLPSVKEAYSKSLSLAWPSALESVLIALIASIDTMMVGSLGPQAISAVGITTQPKFLLMAAVLSLNTGVTAVVARRTGEGDIAGASRTLKQCLTICIMFSFVMLAIALLIPRQLMQLAGANSEYIETSIEYFRIIMIGQFFANIGTTINAAQRGFGNTKISMRSNIIGNIVNIIFNYLLINGIWIFPKLGVKGAAIATAMCGFTIFVMSVSSVLSGNPARLTLRTNSKWKLDRRTMSSVFRVSSSAFVEQIFLRFGFFTYASLVANLGTLAFAAHQICINIINISFSFADGLGIASTSLVGQGLGEKRPDLAMIYGKVGQRCSFTIGIILSIVFIIFRTELIMLFTTDTEVIELGAKIIYIISVICLAQTSQVVISGCLRGAGDSRFVAITSFISVGIFRPGASWLLCYPLGLGLAGAWLGFLIDQTLRLVLNFGRFKTGKWTKIAL